MLKSKWIKASVGAFAALALTACSSGNGNDSKATESKDDQFTVAMVTDIGGVDDKSFNQSAWEGLQAWGKENGLERGADGFDYIQSNSDSDFIPNLNTTINNGFDITVAIGYKLKPAITDISKKHTDKYFAIIDEVVLADNVASYTFKDNEAAFLAGVAAAETTKTNKVGFIGGAHSPVIDRFEAGFAAGVKAANPNVEVNIEYVDSFGDAAKGKQLAAAMYANGADIIYQAAGASGKGVFSEAKDIKKSDSSKAIWVIGVDRDQTDEGNYDGGNLTLTSTLKGVGAAIQKLANEGLEGKFPAGQHIMLGLKEGAVDLTDGNLTEEVKAKVNEFKEKILNGEIEVPEKP
ncbi:BMP family lipoprotein [Atopobacter phocae]|uniref:BMP family lipoprotein n=1 Tax=Atopobacter phocae TaxID=136492 RepID=UPI00046EB593|nr:BMP family protein [Atopobacter phocae]